MKFVPNSIATQRAQNIALGYMPSNFFERHAIVSNLLHNFVVRQAARSTVLQLWLHACTSHAIFRKIIAMPACGKNLV